MSETTNLKPRRPYLLRAIFDWLLDNELTPYLLVDATKNGVNVPLEFVQNDKIVLNIAPHAVGNFEMTDDFVQFSARFSGVSQQVVVPMSAVLAIYSRENGQGIAFEKEPQYENDQTYSQPNNEEKSASPFKIVK